MNKKLFVFSFVLVFIFVLSVSPSFAQGGNPPESMEIDTEKLSALAETLGLSVEDLQSKLNEVDVSISSLFEEAGIEVPYYELETAQLIAVLGITEDELQARLDNGDTLATIYAEIGLDLSAFESNTNNRMNGGKGMGPGDGNGNDAPADAGQGNGGTPPEGAPADGDGTMKDENGRGSFGLNEEYTAQLQTVANVLGISVEELQTQLNEYFGEYVLFGGIMNVMGPGGSGPMDGNGKGDGN